MEGIEVYECLKINGFQCRELNYEVLNEDVVKIATSKPVGLLVTHSPNNCIICTGSEFQVLVWGSQKHTLWLLKPGENYCIEFKNCYLDQCSENIIAISRQPGACRDLTLTQCEEKLLNTLLHLNYKYLFITSNIEYETPVEIPIIVKHEDEKECIEKLNSMTT